MTHALTFTDPGRTFPVLAFVVVFVACSMLMSIGVGAGEDTTAGFYLGERRLAPGWNGLAMFGTFTSAAAFLGYPGKIALLGYEGVPYLLAPMVGWVVLLVLVAEPFCNSGQFTVGGLLASRLASRPVHRAAGIATLMVSMPYLIAQLVGAGVLAAPLLGLPDAIAQRIVVVCLGGLMIMYAVFGGMRGATLVQCIKGILLLAGGAYLAFQVFQAFHWNPNALLNTAVNRSPLGRDLLIPGADMGHGMTSKVDFISLQMGFLFGVAGLPHLLMRLGTVSTPLKARMSVKWATILVCACHLLSGIIGFGAAAVVGAKAIEAANPSGNSATLMLARAGGSFALTATTCVAFITILAVVAGITLTAATALAHDIYGVAIMRGNASDQSELRFARMAIFLIGTISTVLALYVQSKQISDLVGLAFAIAASAILPAILYGLYWRGFTTRGATWSIYGGLISAVLLLLLSPAVSGAPTALFPHAHFTVFPLRNPGIVSIPVGFLLGWLVSVLDSQERQDSDAYAKHELRALAISHSHRD